jgi:hypothetical protein
MHEVCGCFDLPAGLESEGLPAALEAFLGAGPSPVYMTVGSMLPVEESEEDLTRGLIQAALAVGCRTIVQSTPAGLAAVHPRCYSGSISSLRNRP